MGDLFFTDSQRTPDFNKDVVNMDVVTKKTSVSSSKSVRQSSAKSTPELAATRTVTPKTNDNQVSINIYHVLLSTLFCCV